MRTTHLRAGIDAWCGEGSATFSWNSLSCILPRQRTGTPGCSISNCDGMKHELVEFYIEEKTAECVVVLSLSLSSRCFIVRDCDYCYCGREDMGGMVLAGCKGYEEERGASASGKWQLTGLDHIWLTTDWVGWCEWEC